MAGTSVPPSDFGSKRATNVSGDVHWNIRYSQNGICQQMLVKFVMRKEGEELLLDRSWFTLDESHVRIGLFVVMLR